MYVCTLYTRIQKCLYTCVDVCYINMHTEMKQHVFHVKVMSDSLWPHGLHPSRLLCPWDFPGRSTGVGCHFLFQGIFLTQELNPCLLWLTHCRQILYHWATDVYDIDVIIIIFLFYAASQYHQSMSSPTSTESLEMWAMAWSTVNTRFYLLQTVYFIGQQHHHA